MHIVLQGISSVFLIHNLLCVIHILFQAVSSVTLIHYYELIKCDFPLYFISGHQGGHAPGAEREQLPGSLRAVQFWWPWCTAINRDESRFPHSVQTSFWWSSICRSAGEGVTGQSWDENTIHLSTSKGLSWWGMLKWFIGCPIEVAIRSTPPPPSPI